MTKVGRGAILYDLRPPERRRCCRQEGGRHLHQVTGVFKETTTGEVRYRVEDGTYTVREWFHEDDLLAEGMFEPAGWSWPVGKKITFWLTRRCGVEDHHDLMTDGGFDRRIVVQRETPPPHTDGWTVKAEITDELADALAALESVVDPHSAAEVNPNYEGVEEARETLRGILEVADVGEGGRE